MEGTNNNGNGQPPTDKVFVTIGQHKLDLKRKSKMDSMIPEFNDITIEHQIEPPPCPYDHLILVVHGIGKHNDGYFEMIEKLNKKFTRMHRRKSGKRTKFIAIEWHEVIREGVGTIIQDVTPSQNYAKSLPKSIRSAIDDSFMDYVIFNDSQFALQIYTEVIDQLNTAYMDFIRLYPAFSGKVSLYGHSLGSIILYDILTHQPEIGLLPNEQQESNISSWKKVRKSQLKDDYNSNKDVNQTKPEFKHPHAKNFLPLVFQTYNFITTGSPVGVIVGLRRYNYLPIPLCTNFYNIYNICDPVAYLVEPIIHKSHFQKLEPYFLPRSSRSSPKNGTSKKKSNKKGAADDSDDDESSDDDYYSGDDEEKEPQDYNELFLNKTNGGSGDSNQNLNGNNKRESQINIGNKNNNNSNKRDSQISIGGKNNNNKRESQINIGNNQSPDNSSKEDKLFSNNRFDFAIKPKGIHISEYSPLLTAHSDYWLSREVLSFIGSSLN